MSPNLRSQGLASLLPRAGVSPSYVWLPNGPWKTIGEFFIFRFPHVGLASWESRMTRGEVRDEHSQALQLASPYRAGACVFYYREPEEETPIPFQADIIYQDGEILIADKPHFLPVIPGGRFLHETLLVRLKNETGIASLVPLHRLDRETAGLVMFSVNPSTRHQWLNLFRERTVKKIYEAHASFNEQLSLPCVYRSRLVKHDQFFKMKELNGEPNSETIIRLHKRDLSHTSYLLEAVTGKMHQLRVHMMALGLPLLNDALYPITQAAKSDDFTAPLKLLARSLTFKNPINGNHHFFESRRSLHE